MPTSHSLRHRTVRKRARRAVAVRMRALALALTVWVAAAAGGLGISRAIAQQGAQQEGAARAPRHPSAALEHAARYMMALPGKADSVTLAAQGTQEGHWRFVNRTGEMFTVGTPDEMQRVISVLYPEARAGARVLLYLTEDTVFRHRATLKALPASADLNMVVRGRSYRLWRASAEPERLLAEVRSNLGLETRDEQPFHEALWHLARPLRDARVRVLALEPGGPGTLPAWPRIDPASRGALVDVVDPARLPAAMSSVSGQILIVVGRAEAGLLYVRAAGGREHGVPLSGLIEAAAGADANLVVLTTAATPRQPSGRNALWPGSGSPDAEAGLERATVADLLSGMAGPGRRLALSATAAGKRTALDATTGSDPQGAPPARSAAERLAGLVGELTARAVPTGVRVNLVGAAQQRELDRRLIAAIPAAVQIAYLTAIALGLLGVPVARSWWSRIWAPEQASEYAGRGGFWAACAVRHLVFLLLFAPMVAAVAAPASLARRVRDGLRSPGRAWRWHSERRGQTPRLEAGVEAETSRRGV